MTQNMVLIHCIVDCSLHVGDEEITYRRLQYKHELYLTADLHLSRHRT